MIALSEQLMHAAGQLSAMHCAGELATLPDSTRTEIAGLALFLAGAADVARDLECATARDNLPPRREGRMVPLGTLVSRIVSRARRP